MRQPRLQMQMCSLRNPANGFHINLTNLVHQGLKTLTVMSQTLYMFGMRRCLIFISVSVLKCEIQSDSRLMPKHSQTWQRSSYYLKRKQVAHKEWRASVREVWIVLHRVSAQPLEALSGVVTGLLVEVFYPVLLKQPWALHPRTRCSCLLEDRFPVGHIC